MPPKKIDIAIQVKVSGSGMTARRDVQNPAIVKPTNHTRKFNASADGLAFRYVNSDAEAEK